MQRLDGERGAGQPVGKYRERTVQARVRPARRHEGVLQLAVGGERARPAWTVTATLAAGPGTVIASSVADTARAVNQRVWPSGAVSPILVPAAASCLAPRSGTVTLATCTGEPRHQVVRRPAATRLLPVPAGPAAGWPAA